VKCLFGTAREDVTCCRYLKTNVEIKENYEVIVKLADMLECFVIC
jgi:hypothetical protein